MFRRNLTLRAARLTMKFAHIATVLLLTTSSGAVVTADEAPWIGMGHTSSTQPSDEAIADSELMTSAVLEDDGSPEITLPALQRTNLEFTEPTYSMTQVGMTPDVCCSEQTWVLVAPYLWAPATRGTVGARGVTAQIDMSLADLIDLIPDLNGAFMGHVEVGKGNQGLIFDGMLMQLEPSERGPGGGQITFDISSTILEMLAMERIVNIETDAATGSHFTIDLLGGGRYYQVQNGVRINPVIGPTVQADLSKHWVDLVFGARTAATIVPGIDGFFRADFGGFGIGTSSKLAWNLTTGVEYACASHPGTSMMLGYRILDIDETQKTGAQQFVYDVKMQGPFIAFAFRF